MKDNNCSNFINLLIDIYADTIPNLFCLILGIIIGLLIGGNCLG